MEELSALYPIKTLHGMYELAFKDPYSFWYINLDSHKKDDMFYVRFDDKIVVD